MQQVIDDPIKIMIQIAKIGIPGIRAVQTAEDFKSAMSKIQALAGQTAENIEAMSWDLLRIVVDTGKPLTDTELAENEQGRI